MRNYFFNSSIFIVVILFVLVLPNSAFSQFGIPKIPKVPKPTPEVKTDSNSGQNNNNGQKNNNAQKIIIPGHYDFSATEPTLDKTSLTMNILTATYANGKETETWIWTPGPKFKVNGPIDSGSVVNVNFTMPDGTPWFSQDCANLNKVSAGYPVDVECEAHTPEKDKKATAQSGVFGFTITLSNELSGKKVELISGKFKVDKYLDNPTNNPKFNKHFMYYTPLDWKMPMALVYTTQPKDQYDTFGPLKVMMWFRGERKTIEYNNLVGHLFYNGTEVAATNAVGSNNVTDPISDLTTAQSPSGWDQHGMVFTFNAKAFERDSTNADVWFPIYKNPGEYEIKILQNGKLARTAKFTVDSNGNIVNNGWNKDNKLGTTKILIPATIIGEQDTKFDKTAWQSQGFWGIPLVGFTAQ